MPSPRGTARLLSKAATKSQVAGVIQSSALARWAQGFALFASTVGAAVLASYAAGQWGLLTFGERYVPMAPATALLVFLVAGALVLTSRRGPEARSRPAAVLATLAALFAFFLLWHAIGGGSFVLEVWLFPSDLMMGGVPVGRISPHTAAMLLVLSLALALPNRSSTQRAASTALVLMTLTTSALILQAYLLRGPVLYGLSTIPVAATTAACILSLSLGALMLVGVDHWPLRVLIASDRPTSERRGWFRALVLALSVFVSLSGLFWYRGERSRAEERAQEALLTVAEATAIRLDDWHRTQLADARAVRALAPTRARAVDVRVVTRWLDSARAAFGHEFLGIFDADGRPLAVSTASAAVPLDSLGARVRALGDTTAMVVDDIAAEGERHPFSVWLRLDPAARPGRRWLLVRTDARPVLALIVRGLATSSRTREIIVYRREGDAAMPLHDLRRVSNARLQMRRLPDSSASRMGVVGVMGREGIVNIIDYSGAPVTAAIKRVPSTPWIVIAKVDRAELAAPVFRLAIRATVVSLFLVLAAAAVYGLWRRREIASLSREVELMRERAATTEELRRSEDRYARASRGTTDGIWDWDLATGELYLSPRWREAMGVAPEGTADIQSMFIARLHAEDAHRARAAFEEHLAKGSPLDLEVRLADDAGAYHWIWTRGEAERDASGKPVRMAGAVTDVTPRRQAEETLQRLDRILRMRSAASQSLIRATTEQELLQGVCDVAVREGGYRMAWVGYAQPDDAKSVQPMAVSGDDRGYVAAINASWDEGPLGNGPAGRAIRSRVPQVFHDLTTERGFAPWLAAALEHGYGSACSIPLSLSDGTQSVLVLYASDPLAFHASEVELLVELGEDLAFGIKAKRDNDAVAAQQAQLTFFRQVMDRSEDAIFVIDVATGRFIDFNQTALRQLGYTAAEMRTLGAHDVVPRFEQQPQKFQELVAEIARGEPVTRRSAHRRKNGSVYPVDVSRTIVRTEGREVMLAVVRDVSALVHADAERASLQEQLLRSHRMESVGRLAGGIAHDFNNLLTVINASAEFALTELPPDSPVAEDLTQIRAAGERAAALTRQLLAFSRQQVMRREHLDLNAVVSKFLGMLRRVIGEDVRLEASLAAQETPVFADPGQLEQVLMNLCVNARDAMPRGGTMTIATRRVDLDAEFASRHETVRAGPHVLLAISDTGVGMSAEMQSSIFDPFFTTKEAGKGTGLGLATVYGIVKQSGGSIWVRSEVGHGSTFDVYFPLSEHESAPPATPPPATPPRGSETILVVEDEEGIRTVMRRLLSQAGYTVVEASSANEALERIATHRGPLDLVITDIVMPGISGIEMARMLRAERPGLRIILSSGYAAEAIDAHLDKEPGWSLISKPYMGQTLLREVRRVLDEQPAGSPRA